MDKDEVARKIMNYLHKNPAAGDTLEGITKWWIQSECVEQSVKKVADVLEKLVKEGLVKKHDIRGSSPLYRICKKTY